MDAFQECRSKLMGSSDGDAHYRAVCRALVSEAVELSTFVEKVSKHEMEMGDMVDEIQLQDWVPPSLGPPTLQKALLKRGAQRIKHDQSSLLPWCRPAGQALGPGAQGLEDRSEAEAGVCHLDPGGVRADPLRDTHGRYSQQKVLAQQGERENYPKKGFCRRG